MNIVEIIGIIVIVLLFFIFTWNMLTRLIWDSIRGTIHPSIPDIRKNNDYKAGLLTVQGIKKANKEYRLVSGNLHPNVYNREMVNEILKTLDKKPKLKIRILVGPEIFYDKSGINYMWKAFQSQKYGERLQIRLLTDYPEEHFKVVDLNETYIGKPHKPNAKERYYSIYKPSYTNALIYARIFDKAWEKLKTVQPEPKFSRIPDNMEEKVK